MKQTTISRLILALSLCSGTSLFADEASDLTKSVTAMDAADKSPAAQAKAVDHVCKELRVPREKLDEQRKQTGLGTGSLFIANTLAKETGKPFEEIVAAHRNGKGWGLIAKENGVKLGPLVSQAKRAEKGAVKAPKGDKSGEVGDQSRPKPPRGGPPKGNSPSRGKSR